MSNARVPLARVQAAEAAVGGTPPSSNGRARTPARRPPQTAHDAHAALQRVEGAERAIERVPGLGMPEVWGEIACFGINDRRGHVAYETFIWDADFPAVGWTVENGWENGLVYFQARSQDSPPLARTGRSVATYGEGGYNVMQPVLRSIQLEGYPTAHAEFLIDDHSFGQFDVPGNPSPIEPLLVANLAATGVGRVAAHKAAVNL